MKTIKFFFILGVLFILALSGCSEIEQEIPTQSTMEDPLTKLLKDVPADVRSEILKAFPEDFRKVISKEITEDHLSLSKRSRLIIALIQVAGPPPFFDPNECAPLLTVGPLTGNGKGTVIGKHTILQSHCLNPETFEFSNGKVTMTTVNGYHQLFETYYGTLTPTQNPDSLIIRGITSLTGGTGRFNGATGSGFAIGTLNPNTGAAVLLNISTLYIR